MKKSIFWFRKDLRLSDNPGLYEAAMYGNVLPLFIVDDTEDMGSASQWWLYHSLKSLNQSLNNGLHIYVGDQEKLLPHIAKKNDIKTVYWNKSYEPEQIQKDSRIEVLFQQIGIECKTSSAYLLWEPSTIGKAYKVYTPFYKNGCLNAEPPRRPIPAPEIINTLPEAHKDQFFHKEPWHKKIEAHWNIGEEAAQSRLTHFLSNGLEGYKENRNSPSTDGTSRLSPHLHFGEISINQVWYSVQTQRSSGIQDADIDCFLSELGWREFCYHLLDHFPELPSKNFQKKFDEFPWQYDENLLKAWQKGQTGHPIVDAGMRELWQTGYMHNRVRMIVASFLVKNLLIHWHCGRDWFWDCLVDADLANNSANWQWVAGCGADAAPYFRIFNPVLQGEKFDSEGLYTRHFVPELKLLPNKYLFKPWQAPSEVLKAAGIVLGKNYPLPIVDLDSSRKRALQALRSTNFNH